MWIKAAKMCWLSLALKYKQCSPDEIEESLYDCDYSWELHWEFLLNKARMRLGRIRHRVSEVNSSAKEVDSQIQQSNGDARTTSVGTGGGVTSQSCLNTKTVQSRELEDSDNALPDNEPIPQSFNLFGNSIISKQG